MKDWRNWELGRKTIYTADDFDGSMRLEGTITEVCKDHLICSVGDIILWIDDDTIDAFS